VPILLVPEGRLSILLHGGNHLPMAYKKFQAHEQRTRRREEEALRPTSQLKDIQISNFWHRRLLLSLSALPFQRFLNLWFFGKRKY
jgi:hypothetical protein